MAEDELYEKSTIAGAPWLFGTHENDDAKLEEQTFFSMNNNTSRVTKIVELQGKFIYASSMGWLILQDRVNERMYSLWNPVTRQSIILPELPYGRGPEKCILTSPPYEDGFDNATKSVLLFIYSGAVFSCRLSSTRDDLRWVKQRLEHDGLSAHLYRIAAVNGDIYAIAYMYDHKLYNGVKDSEDDDEIDKEDSDGVDNEEDDDSDNEDDDGVDNNEEDDDSDKDDDDDTDNTFCVRLKVSDDSDFEENDGVDNEDDDDSDDEVDNEDDDDTDNEDDDDDDGSDNEDNDDGRDTTFCVRLKVSDDNSDGSSTSVLIEQLSVGYPLSSIVYNMGRIEAYYLVEVCGDLYAVYIIPRQLVNQHGYDILKAFVSRWDMSKRKWIQVESIGDRALLLSAQCCTWCWAYESQGQIEGNCIYVAKSKTDIIHQYRLQDNSYTFVSTHSNFGFCSLGPFWFMPHNDNPTRFSSLIKEEEHAIVENTKHVELREETGAEIPASSLLELPSVILISIAHRMHWFQCMNFRATCKTMRSEISRPQWKANSLFPLFMFLTNTQGICELWDPCYQNNGSIIKKFPYSPSIVSTIEFCKDDWLILRSHEGCYLQYMNIFTGETCEYPTNYLPGGLSSFAFSTCPTSPDCITLGINSRGCFSYARICLLQAGTDKWEVFEFYNGEHANFNSNYKSSPKYHDGAFYFLGENGNLGVFKILDGEGNWEVHDGPLRKDDSSKLNECYIVELDGQLVCVFIQAFGLGIQVYNFDINQKLWIELKSLGDYTLFVSAASSLSVPTKDSSMRNIIYLPKRIGNEMVFYSLDTGKYHTSCSKDSFENFCD